MDRLTMNPSKFQTLKDNFYEDYNEIFSKCSLIVSAPGSFFWTGEYSVMYGGIGIVQKLPFKMYVGFEPINEDKIEFEALNFFVISRQSFYKNSSFIEDIRATKLKKLLSEYTSGIKIHILSEFAPGCGLNSSGAFASALAVAIKLYSKQITIEEVNKWNEYTLDELKNKKELKFDEVFKLAWKIESIFHSEKTSGITAFNGLIDSYYPIVFASKREEDKNINTFERIEKSKYWAFRMEEIFKLDAWPIDFGLVYSGATRNTNLIMQSYNKNLINTFDRSSKLISNFFSDPKNEASNFIEIVKNSSGEEIFQKYMDTLSITSLLVLESFRDLFENNNERPLFYNLNRYQENLKLIGISTWTIDQIIETIQEEVNKIMIPPESFAAKISGSGMGGDILFACSFVRLRSDEKEILDTLCKKISPKITLDYCSWIDGFGNDGVRVEQNLDSMLKSKYTSKKIAKVKSWNEKSEGICRLIALENIQKEINKIHLLLDIPKHSIYILGKKLTSYEIHSSITTINVLNILLENIGKSISNKNLPRSSYSIDRNEMQGKIIIPIKRAFEKITGKDLDISINGDITNFKIKIENQNLDIRIIEEIQ